ncbi:hypothetical protein EDB84DRAFT_1442247 [Lactarius hengduanensis]|nr:hypothetical protein EDB84DRAFT_1442247 [Lactarius hengduanensis]
MSTYFVPTATASPGLASGRMSELVLASSSPFPRRSTRAPYAIGSNYNRHRHRHGWGSSVSVSRFRVKCVSNASSSYPTTTTAPPLPPSTNSISHHLSGSLRIVRVFCHPLLTASFTSDLGVPPGCLGGSTFIFGAEYTFPSWRPLDRYSGPPPPPSPSDDLRPPSSYRCRGVAVGRSILTWHLVSVGEEEGGAGREWQACPSSSPYRGAMLDTYTLSVVVESSSPGWRLLERCSMPLPPPSPSDDLRPPLSYCCRGVAEGCRVGEEEGRAGREW